MAEGDYNFHDSALQKDDDLWMNEPPTTGNANQQDEIAAEMANIQNPNIQNPSIIMEDNKMTGTGGAPETVPAGEEGAVTAQHEAKRQQEQAAKISATAPGGEGGKPPQIKGELFSGITADILKRIPGLASSLNAFKTSDLKGRIKILKKLNRRLKIAKSGAAIADAVRTWLEIFVPTVETIVIPIIMILLIPFWLFVFVAFQDKVPGATMSKTISKATKTVGKTLNQYLKAAQSEQQNQQRTAAVQQT